MPFTHKHVKFTLKDIGSNVIDQLSSDIYSGTSSIIRELAKNAYDSYLPLTQDELDDEGISREILVSRQREAGVGRLFVGDIGIGQSMDDLKANVQISISRKATEVEGATGFRGLGSWASLGAGSRITITSSKKGHTKNNRLILNVRAIYKKMGPSVTLDEILNDVRCISFEEEANYPAERHGTVVEIECDGPTERIGKYELNRLYAYTDQNEGELRDILIESCPIAFTSEGGAYEQIHKIYERVGYIPTKVFLDGVELVKRLPAELTELVTDELKHGADVAAYVWTASNPRESREISQIDDRRHTLGGPGIRLLKLNVPIGRKNIFSDGIIRASTPSWYVGEVHVTLPDVLPDAGGQGLRAGTARQAFIQILESFYKDLESQAEAKSARLSMERHLRKGMEAAKKLNVGGKVSAADKVRAEAAIAKAVELINDTSTPGRAKTVRLRHLKEAAKDGIVKIIRTEARKVLLESGHLARFTRPKRKLKKQVSSGKVASVAHGALISMADLQARLGEAVPRFTDIGLTEEQVDQVFQIINECVLGESEV